MNMDRKKSPAALLRALLKEKGWTQEELALIIGRSRRAVTDILSERTGITAETAVVFAAAFGNKPEEWLSLEIERQLSSVKTNPDDVERRRLIYELAPIRDMQRRNWISGTKDIGEIEAALKNFFEAEDLLSEPISFPVAARRTIRLPNLNKAEQAWCFEARRLARAVRINPFNPAKLENLRKKLRKLAAYAKEAYRAPLFLAEAGVRFVVVEPLPGTRIDGAAFWLDQETSQSPVIAMSIRYDRLDNFWHTLMHEISHIIHRDPLSIDSNIEGTEGVASVDETEQRANEEAAAALIPTRELDSFIRRVGPVYAKPRIIQFAHRVKIHPGIIVGQLFHRGEIGPGSHREMLVKIRSNVMETAVVDGWGQPAPINL